MTEEQTRAIVANALASIAPEADAQTIDATKDFRLALELDSFDFLRLMQALHDATGVSIPEDDYPLVTTIRGLATYISQRA